MLTMSRDKLNELDKVLGSRVIVKVDERQEPYYEDKVAVIDALKRGESVVFVPSYLGVSKLVNNFSDVVIAVYFKKGLSVEVIKDKALSLTDKIVVEPGFISLRPLGIKWGSFSELVSQMESHPLFKGAVGYNQMNPYHEFRLDKHCYDVCSALIESQRFNTDEALALGLYHDIGKIYTRTFKTPTHAQYLGHENVSGYLALRDGLDERLVRVIYRHMAMHHQGSKRVKAELDKSPYKEDLIVFHHCDKD